MQQLLAITVLIAGAALGIGCGLLFLIAKRRESMAWGLGSVIVTFIAISIAIFVVRALAPDVAMPSGVLAVISFLVTATVVLIRAHGENL